MSWTPPTLKRSVPYIGPRYRVMFTDGISTAIMFSELHRAKAYAELRHKLVGYWRLDARDAHELVDASGHVFATVTRVSESDSHPLAGSRAWRERS